MMSLDAKSAIGSIFLLLVIGSFAAGDDQAGDEGAAYFETHIRPLFVRHCYQCHSARAQEKQGDLLLDRREGWIQGGERGPSVIPGNADSSPLIRAIRSAEADLEMPPNGPLSEEDIARLVEWVRIGAPGPRDAQTVAFDDPSDPIAGKSHWAFQLLVEERPPAVKAVQWPRTAIDHFVLAGLEEQGLQPVADASSRDLLRRVVFQLTGLPPSRQQVEDFLAEMEVSSSSEARRASSPQSADGVLAESDREPLERLVDRLMASPQYGERWGRHWLDLARYADSNGLDENFLFREAWRYRNWVLDATNVDLSFDRFIQEQIAGDLLPFESIEQRDRQRIAAGFMVIGPKVLLGIDKDRQRMDIADEQIDTIGRGILGQTLGCARCHDHKFDPVPTADYYAMAGIFSSTQVMESRYMLGQQRVMERLVGLGLHGDEADEAYEKYWREQPQLREKKKHAEAGLAALEEDNATAFQELIENHIEALAEGARDTALTLDERIAHQKALVAELSKTLSHPPEIPPRAMIPADVEQPADEAIRLAGEFDESGEMVSRGFLTVLCDGEQREITVGQSGRMALAQWLTDGDGRAGELAARVLANRIWKHLMGRGLVATVDNFGRTGETPTHRELLDYLARELIDSGWSTKALVRQIVLSRTFALSSGYHEGNDGLDPENRMLWRAHRRRLEPEAIRDAILSAAGQLDLATVGSTVAYLGDQATAVGPNKVRRRTDFHCRSVYLPVVRNDLPEVFEAFDFTNPHMTTGARPKTIVPSQGLFMLNDEMVMDAAEATAARILSACPTADSTARIDQMFALLLNDLPTESERRVMAQFLSRTEASLRGDCVEEYELRALTIACHALFASSRFQFLD